MYNYRYSRYLILSLALTEKWFYKSSAFCFFKCIILICLFVLLSEPTYYCIRIAIIVRLLIGVLVVDKRCKNIYLHGKKIFFIQNMVVITQIIVQTFIMLMKIRKKKYSPGSRRVLYLWLSPLITFKIA